MTYDDFCDTYETGPWEEYEPVTWTCCGCGMAGVGDQRPVCDCGVDTFIDEVER